MLDQYIKEVEAHNPEIINLNTAFDNIREKVHKINVMRRQNRTFKENLQKQFIKDNHL